MRYAAIALVFVVSACKQAPVKTLSASDSLVYERALSGLLSDSALAEGPHAARGFCVGFADGHGPESQRSWVLDPTGELMSHLVDVPVDIYPASECELRAGWGDRRHLPTDRPVGSLLLSGIVERGGTPVVEVDVEGGPYGSAGYECHVPSKGKAKCALQWLN